MGHNTQAERDVAKRKRQAARRQQDREDILREFDQGVEGVPTTQQKSPTQSVTAQPRAAKDTPREARKLREAEQQASVTALPRPSGSASLRIAELERKEKAGTLTKGEQKTDWIPPALFLLWAGLTYIAVRATNKHGWWEGK